MLVVTVMNDINHINFLRLDWPLSANMQKAIEDLAVHLMTYKDNFSYVVRIVRHAASWRMNNWKNNYEKWKASMLKLSKSSDIVNLVGLIKSCFSSCLNDDDIKKVRGSIQEQYAFNICKDLCGSSLGILNVDYKIETGCSVEVNGSAVEYHCAAPYSSVDDCDDNCYTVDIAIWDKLCGTFFELKLSPDKFFTKNIRLMREIKLEMEKEMLASKFILYSWGCKDLTIAWLEAHNLWVDDEFIILDSEDDMWNFSIA